MTASQSIFNPNVLIEESATATVNKKYTHMISIIAISTMLVFCAFVYENHAQSDNRELGRSGQGSYTMSSKMMSAKNIPYQTARGWDPELSNLDIFYQEAKSGTTLRPVIVFVHGGGWTKGDKSYISKKNYRAIPEYFIDQGYIFVAINFRLALNPKSPDTKIPDMALDIAKALKWLSVNVQRYGGRTSGFILWGYSSGAHLASLVATDQSYLRNYQLSKKDIKGVIAMDVPQYDVPQAFKLLKNQDVGPWDEAKRAKGLQKIFGRTKRQQKKISPAHFLSSKEKPNSFLLISAGLNRRKPQSFSYQMTKHFKDQLIKNGVSARHFHFENYNHSELISKFFDGDISDIVKAYLDGIEDDLSDNMEDATLDSQIPTPPIDPMDVQAERDTIRKDDVTLHRSKRLEPAGGGQSRQPPNQLVHRLKTWRDKIIRRLKMFDHDGDGKISQDDVPAAGQRAFRHIDTNNDGTIDTEELDRFQKK